MVKLPRGWAIDADMYCYSVGKLHDQKRNDGTTIQAFVHPHYFSSIEACLNDILQSEQKSVVESKMLTLKEALEEFKEIKSFWQKYFDENIGQLKELVIKGE